VTPPTTIGCVFLQTVQTPQAFRIADVNNLLILLLHLLVIFFLFAAHKDGEIFIQQICRLDLDVLDVWPVARLHSDLTHCAAFIA
jgi:hypothetical protein